MAFRNPNGLACRYPFDGSFPITQSWGVNSSGYVAPGGKGGYPGVDWGTPNGTPLFAIADGIVTWAQPAQGFGLHCVAIWSPQLGVTSLLGHCMEHFVVEGQEVHIGQRVATADNQGESTGPHLHEEIRPVNSPFGNNPTNIDPVAFHKLHNDLKGTGIGPMTDEAKKNVRFMQARLGLPVASQTGYWGDVTDNLWNQRRWFELTDARGYTMVSMAAGKPAKGKPSTFVREMQRAVFHYPAPQQDGIWGPKTNLDMEFMRLLCLKKV